MFLDTHRSDYLVNPLDWQLPLPDDSRASANATEGETKAVHKCPFGC